MELFKLNVNCQPYLDCVNNNIDDIINQFAMIYQDEFINDLDTMLKNAGFENQYILLSNYEIFTKSKQLMLFLMINNLNLKVYSKNYIEDEEFI
ncbi:MAG TPA: hypothetical protein PK222_06050 [Bacteroidales bacterium]|jgi:hypothetical protein|nr:hypothetical protein [Bacteroidales bacterium]HQL12082.1 hypothetical protein [bacterium]